MPGPTCTNCKRRKTKCDRESPCGACVKSYLDLSCNYGESIAHKGSDLIRVVTSDDFGSKRKRKEKCKTSSSSGSTATLHSANGISANNTKNSNQPRNSENPKSPTSNSGSDTAYNRSTSSGEMFVSPNSPPHSGEFAVKGLQDLAINNHPDQGIFKNNGMLGMNPINKMDDTINLHDTYMLVNKTDRKRKTNQGPFAWSSLMKKDPGLRILMTYLKNPAFKTFGMLDNDLSLKKVPSSETSSKVQDARLQELLYRSNEQSLIDRILAALPPRRAIWVFIDNFFDMVFPSIPCIDEFEFHDQVSSLIGGNQRTDERVTALAVYTAEHLSQLGLLLVVLKYSELCLQSKLVNDGSTPPINMTNLPDDDLQYLVNFRLSRKIVELADSCVNHFAVYKAPDLISLQLMIYLTSVQYYAPEETDMSESGLLYSTNGVLIQMAFKLGLHLNPDSYEDASSDLRQDNLTRKIWSYLLFIDLVASCSTGDPKIVQHSHYDNKLIVSRLNVHNVKNSKIDQLLIITLSYVAQTVSPICGLLEIVTDINKKHLVSTVCNYLTTFEKAVPKLDETIMALKHNYTEDSVEMKYLNTIHVKFMLLFSGFIVSMNHQLLLYYENINSNLSFFYSKKLLHVITTDLMPHYIQFINEKSLIQAFTNPVAIRFVHKSNQSIMALLIRVNCDIFRQKNSPDHAMNQVSNESYKEQYNNLLRLSNLLLNCCYYACKTLDSLSTKYYYAWALTKGCMLFNEIISQDKFYEENDLVNAYTLGYNNEQVKELISICENTSKFYTQSDYDFFNASRNNFSIYLDTTDFNYHFSKYDLSDIDKAWLNMITKNANPANQTDFIPNLFDPILDASFGQYGLTGDIPDLY